MCSIYLAFAFIVPGSFALLRIDEIRYGLVFVIECIATERQCF